MTTLLEPTIEQMDDVDNDDVVGHLYHSGIRVAFCGISSAQDNHHPRHPSVPWAKGMFSCPTCGAPICMDCILKAS